MICCKIQVMLIDDNYDNDNNIIYFKKTQYKIFVLLFINGRAFFFFLNYDNLSFESCTHKN